MLDSLSKSQREFYDAVVVEDKSVCCMGPGGSGKTYVVDEIVAALKTRHGEGAVAVTASTGRSAFQIRGMTLHSFAGVGLADDTSERLAARIKFSSPAADRWKNTKVLIIDEISMISGQLFDKLEYIARRIRSSQMPFGGIQLVLCGDFLQLPPVGINKGVNRSFEAQSWSKCIRKYVALDKVFRQSDEDMVKFLNRIRLGRVDEFVTSMVAKMSRGVIYDDGLEPVVLYTTKRGVESYNDARLSQINAPEHRFLAIDSGSGGTKRSKSSSDQFKQCPAPQELVLKVGAQVMLIKNLTPKLTNGTVGTVVNIIVQPADKSMPGSSDRKTPVVRFDLQDKSVKTTIVHRVPWEIKAPSGSIQCCRKQIPLILAWGMTVHKSQGQTIQRLKVDLDGCFEVGQAYTALSRAVSTNCLEIVNFKPGYVVADSPSVAFCVNNGLVKPPEEKRDNDKPTSLGKPVDLGKPFGTGGSASTGIPVRVGVPVRVGGPAGAGEPVSNYVGAAWI